MKITLILSLLIVLPWSSYAQQSTTPVYNQEYKDCTENYMELETMMIQKQGYSSKYLKNGKPFTGCAKYAFIGSKGDLSEYLVADIKDGYAIKLTYYFPDGSISREFNFKDGLAHGLHIMYYRNGDIYIEEYYNEGKPHGSQKRWLENGEAGRIGLYDYGLPIFDMVYVADTKC